MNHPINDDNVKKLYFSNEYMKKTEKIFTEINRTIDKSSIYSIIDDKYK